MNPLYPRHPRSINPYTDMKNVSLYSSRLRLLD